LGCLKIPYQNNLEVNKNYFKKELTSKRSLKNGYSALLFGFQMPGRSFSSPDYRYGFNGMEKESDITDVDGAHLDFGARIYDSRLVKFLSLDPKMNDYPSESNYIFAGNNPIFYIDVNGEFKYSASNDAEYRKSYPMITKYLSEYIENDIMSSSKIVNAYQEVNPNISKDGLNAMVKWGQGFEISFTDKPGNFPVEFEGAAGFTDRESHRIDMNSKYANYLEKVLQSGASEEDKLVALTRFYKTLLHEQAHANSILGEQTDKSKELYNRHDGDYTSEDGRTFDEKVWGTSDNDNMYNTETQEGIEGVQSGDYYPNGVEKVIENANKTKEGKESLPTVPAN